MKRILSAVVLTTALVAPALAEDAVCYNCPPQWADWASMLEAIDGLREPLAEENQAK